VRSREHGERNSMPDNIILVSVFRTIQRPCTVPYHGMLRRVALVRSDIRRNVAPPSSLPWNPQSYIAFLHEALLIYLPWWLRSYVPPKRRFLQEPHCVTSKKTAYFIDTAVKIYLT
jgi:hypothetical protein